MKRERAKRKAEGTPDETTPRPKAKATGKAKAAKAAKAKK